jgi:hypothetical protein
MVLQPCDGGRRLFAMYFASHGDLADIHAEL